MGLKTVRQGVFETNSSSVHALSIKKNPTTTKEEISSYLLPSVGIFSWSNVVYRDFYDKLSYLYTAILGHDGKDKDRYLNALRSFFVKRDSDVYLMFDQEEADIGFVDHVCETTKILETLLSPENEHLLENFLFSKESYLHTGNDNEYDEQFIPSGGPEEEYVVLIKGN